MLAKPVFYTSDVLLLPQTLTQGPKQDVTSRSVSCLLRLLLAATVSQTFLVLDDLDSEQSAGQAFCRVPSTQTCFSSNWAG